MIIAVNIRGTINIAPTIMEATRRAWRLNLNNANNCDYVVGISNGTVQGYFRLQAAVNDDIEPHRVAFNLTVCTGEEIRIIDAAISNVNLSGFVTKYI